MNELNLTPEKQKEYDSLLDQMMQEIEQELEKVPKRDGVWLDGPRTKVYRDVTNKYLPKIKAIVEAPA